MISISIQDHRLSSLRRLPAHEFDGPQPGSGVFTGIAPPRHHSCRQPLATVHEDQPTKSTTTTHRRKTLTVVMFSALVFGALVWFGPAPFQDCGLDRFLVPDVRDKNLVMYSTHDFLDNQDSTEFLFAEFHSVLGALHWAKSQSANSVRVEFDSPVHDSPQHGPNWWARFFEPSMDLQNTVPGMTTTDDSTPVAANSHVRSIVVTHDSDEVHFNRYFAKFGRLRGWESIAAGTQTGSYHTRGVDRHALHSLIRQHVHLRPELTAKVNTLANDLGLFQPSTPSSDDDGTFVLSVHFRAAQATPFELFFCEIDRVADRVLHHPLGNFQKVVIFVATDEPIFLSAMRVRYGADKVRHRTTPSLSFNPHLPTDSGEQSERLIIDALLLARGAFLIKNKSGLSDASLAFNPDMPFRLVAGTAWSGVCPDPSDR